VTNVRALGAWRSVRQRGKRSSHASQSTCGSVVHVRGSRRSHSCHGLRDALAEQYVGAVLRRLRNTSAFEIGDRQMWVDCGRSDARDWISRDAVHRSHSAARSHLNRDAVAVLEGERGKNKQYCFTYRGAPIRWEMTNSAWHTAIAKAGINDFRFHDLRHTWASWHRQAGTSCDELKDLGGWKSRVIVDRYAKFGTEHLTVAAARIERGCDKNVIELSQFSHSKEPKRA